jgi:hypothetical protein
MSTFPHPWALCGGWAVDAWLGDTTRSHLDVDITVFHDDQRAVFEQLAGWHLAAHDTDTPDGGEGWDGRPLTFPAHIHGRPPGEGNRRLLHGWVNPPYAAPTSGPNLEVVFNLRYGDDLVLSEDPSITVPWADAARESRWHAPTIVPQLLLFWKASAYFDPDTRVSSNTKDAVDFAALAPRLARAQRAWLRDAIASVHPDHGWLDMLEP